MSNKRYEVNVDDYYYALVWEITLKKYPIQYFYFQSVKQLQLVCLNNTVRLLKHLLVLLTCATLHCILMTSSTFHGFFIEFGLVRTEAYSEPCQTFKTFFFAKIVKSFQSLSIFTKSSILEVFQSSEYTSEGWNLHTQLTFTCSMSTKKIENAVRYVHS